MTRPSSIDRLPEEVRAQIGRLRGQGRTMEEILAHLRTLDVEISRSALSRHLKGFEAIRERMELSRNLSRALVDQLGDQTDNRLQQLNLELMQGVVMQIITGALQQQDGETTGVNLSPQDAMFMSRTLQGLASAAKIDAERIIKIRADERARALKDAAGAVADSAVEAGLSPQTAEFIMAKILGVAA